MVDAKGILEALEIPFHLGQPFFEPVVLGHVQAHLPRLLVEVEEELPIPHVRQNVFLP